MELSYPFQIDNIELQIVAGFQLNGINREDAVEAGGEGFYLDGSGFVHLGLTAIKKIKISDKWEIPFSSSIVFNPKRERMFLICGFSF